MQSNTSQIGNLALAIGAGYMRTTEAFRQHAKAASLKRQQNCKNVFGERILVTN